MSPGTDFQDIGALQAAAQGLYGSDRDRRFYVQCTREGHILWTSENARTLFRPAASLLEAVSPRRKWEAQLFLESTHGFCQLDVPYVPTGAQQAVLGSFNFSGWRRQAIFCC